MNEKQRKKAFYQKLIDRIEQGKWNAELRILVVKQIREGIRREFDKISDIIKSIQDQWEKLAEEKPLQKEKMNDLQDKKHLYELDADKMKEQMMGKWVESEQQYHGGLDEEIKSIESNIVGGDEFKRVVEREMRKI